MRDIYSKRFPELESLVLHPLDYARTVLALGNDLTRIPQLSDILPATNVITISMTASSTVGKELSEEELERAFEGCRTSLELDEARKKVVQTVSSHDFIH